MQRFAVFTYVKNGKVRVEAYPEWTDATVTVPHFTVFTASRNQARKWGYRMWVNPTGQGFNRFPLH